MRYKGDREHQTEKKKGAIVNVINYSGAFPACHNVSKCRPRKKVDCD